ncbi:unnamed protein product [Gordionus sp. m RMFG-2023]
MHLRMFEIAKDFFNMHLKIEVKCGIISPVNDKYNKRGLVNSNHRLNMLKSALKSSNWVKLDTWECEQNQWSTTFDVLQHFQQAFNKNDKQDSKVILLCGADLFESFTVPGLWDPQHIKDIIKTFGIAVVTRYGTRIESVFQNLPFLNTLKDKIYIIHDPIPNEISSTKIRAAISRGQSIKYLLPEELIQYIQNHKLYV